MRGSIEDGLVGIDSGQIPGTGLTVGEVVGPSPVYNEVGCFMDDDSGLGWGDKESTLIKGGQATLTLESVPV